VKQLMAITDSKTSMADLVLEIDGASPGHSVGIEMYNGTILTPNGEVTRYKWDGEKPARIKVRYCDSRYLKTDRTVLRMKLPDGRWRGGGRHPCQSVRLCAGFQFFAVKTRRGHWKNKKQIAGKQTILDQVEICRTKRLSKP
jgi:hypothetical protein